MLKIPLDAHGSPNLEITLELDEENRAFVRLNFDLGPNELVGRIPELEVPEDELRIELDGTGPEVELERLRLRVGTLEADLKRRDEHAENLVRSLESIKAERSLWRELLPDEAREIAAGLVHYANEAERVFR